MLVGRPRSRPIRAVPPGQRCRGFAGSRLELSYLAFLWLAFGPTRKRFRNRLSYARQWQEPEGSEDSHGRALWGLGPFLAGQRMPGSGEPRGDCFAAASSECRVERCRKDGDGLSRHDIRTCSRAARRFRKKLLRCPGRLASRLAGPHVGALWTRVEGSA